MAERLSVPDPPLFRESPKLVLVASERFLRNRRKLRNTLRGPLARKTSHPTNRHAGRHDAPSGQAGAYPLAAV
eukprot:415823-Prymnesium_polylepis.1